MIDHRVEYEQRCFFSFFWVAGMCPSPIGDRFQEATHPKIRGDPEIRLQLVTTGDIPSTMSGLSVTEEMDPRMAPRIAPAMASLASWLAALEASEVYEAGANDVRLGTWHIGGTWMARGTCHPWWYRATMA